MGVINYIRKENADNTLYSFKLTNNNRVLDGVVRAKGNVPATGFNGKMIIPDDVIAITKKFFNDLRYYSTTSYQGEIKEVIFPKSLLFLENYVFTEYDNKFSCPYFRPVLDFSNCINLVKINEEAIFKGYDFSIVKIPTLDNGYIWFEKCDIMKLIIKKNVDFTAPIGSEFKIEDCVIDDGIIKLDSLVNYEDKKSFIKNFDIPLSVDYFNATTLNFKNNAYGYYKAMQIKEKDGDKIYYCINQEFKIGEKPKEIEDLVFHENGYHYCTNIKDILHYSYGVYNKDFVVVEIEPGTKIDTHCISDDSETITNTFLPKRILSKKEFIELFNKKSIF